MEQARLKYFWFAQTDHLRWAQATMHGFGRAVMVQTYRTSWGAGLSRAHARHGFIVVGGKANSKRSKEISFAWLFMLKWTSWIGVVGTGYIWFFSEVGLRICSKYSEEYVSYNRRLKCIRNIVRLFVFERFHIQWVDYIFKIFRNNSATPSLQLFSPLLAVYDVCCTEDTLWGKSWVFLCHEEQSRVKEHLQNRLFFPHFHHLECFIG